MKGKKSGWNLGFVNLLFIKLLFTSSDSSAQILSSIFVHGLCGSNTFVSASWIIWYQDQSLPPLPLFWSHLYPCKLSVSIKPMAMSSTIYQWSGWGDAGFAVLNLMSATSGCELGRLLVSPLWWRMRLLGPFLSQGRLVLVAPPAGFLKTIRKGVGPCNPKSISVVGGGGGKALNSCFSACCALAPTHVTCPNNNEESVS